MHIKKLFIVIVSFVFTHAFAAAPVFDHGDFDIQDPITHQKADVVIFTGDFWSMKQCLYSLKEFLKAGYECDRVLFLSTNFDLNQQAKKFVVRYKNDFKDINVVYTYADYANALHKDIIEQARTPGNGVNLQEFYLISGPEHVKTLNDVCIEGAGDTYHGVFVRSISTDFFINQ